MECDLGNLLYVSNDGNLLSSEDLKVLARNHVQEVANKLWELPVEKVDGVVVAKLPKPTFRLPREKPCPKPKKETKWDKFAKQKGIVKKKKGRLVWNDALKKWIPRWGYKSENNQKDWLLEVPGNSNPLEDQFAKKANEKSERVAKNELQRLRNIARNSKGKVMGVGSMPLTKKDSKSDLDRKISSAMHSTASMGDFDTKLKGEGKIKTGKRKKFDSNFQDGNTEKDRNLSVLKDLKDNRPIVDKEKAAKFEQADQQNRRAAKRKAEGEDRREWKNKKPKTPKKQRGTSKRSMNKKKK